jgi:hypothetical protein
MTAPTLEWPDDGLEDRFPDLVGQPLWPALAYAYWTATAHDDEDGISVVINACKAHCEAHGLRVIEEAR